MRLLRRDLFCLLAVILLTAAACSNEPESETVEEHQQPESGEITRYSEGFLGPESALYDAEQDVYFVSNINGGAADVDDNGYISRIHAQTGLVEPRWIDGGSSDVTLNAPKGLAEDDRYIWVADITMVRRFDRRTGVEAEPIAVPGSLFLNAIVKGGDGAFFVSDSGMAGQDEGTGSEAKDAVYRITSEDKVETVAKSQDLHRPNGMVFLNGSLWIVTYGANELYRLEGGKKVDVQTLPKGSLDGLVVLRGGEFMISSWDANGVFRGPPEGPFELVISDLQSPADIELDTRRNLLIVPELMKNTVSLYPVGNENPPAKEDGSHSDGEN